MMTGAGRHADGDRGIVAEQMDSSGRATI